MKISILAAAAALGATIVAGAPVTTKRVGCPPGRLGCRRVSPAEGFQDGKADLPISFNNNDLDHNKRWDDWVGELFDGGWLADEDFDAFSKENDGGLAKRRVCPWYHWIIGVPCDA